MMDNSDEDANALRSVLDGALKEMLGPSAHFRPGQVEAIDAALSGKDCLAILPTGAGKSLVYMLPAAMRAAEEEPGVTIVISPLLSLLRDQTKRCDDLGLISETWTSATDPERLRKIEKDLITPKEDGGPSVSLLFATPEALCGNERLQSSLKTCFANGYITSIAVDEAHCVSQWGHDFRPAYLALAQVRDELLPSTPIQALTATATHEVESGIVDALRLRKEVIIVRAPLNRPNLKYQVLRREALGEGAGKGTEEAAVAHLVQFAKNAVKPPESNNDDKVVPTNKVTIDSSAGGPVGIVFARTRDECDTLTEKLSNAGMDVVSYHAGKSREYLQRAQRCWSAGDIDAVIATVAFGMGVDKPNVRWVAHWGPPATLEGLYQESGRAGRDGVLAHCAMYVGSTELEKLRTLGSAAAKAAFVERYATDDKTCRRAAILKHFGERGGANKKCGESDSKCDVCSDPVAVRKESRVADKVVEKKQEQGAYDALEKRMEQARAKAKERENEKRTKEKGKENSVTPPRVPGKRKFIYPVKT